MTTLHLAIVCCTVLVALVLVVRALTDHASRRAQLQREVAMHGRETTRPVAELAAAVDALVAAAGALERSADQLGPTRIGHRVTVHTKQPDDQTLFGVVVGDYTDRLALDDAEYVLRGQPAQALPGRQDIAKADISWIDVHAHVATPADVTVEA